MSYLDKKVFALIILLFGGIVGLWNWEQHLKIPNFSNETVYYLGTQPDEAGKLIAYDPGTQQTHSLTKEKEVVNEYLLVESKQNDKFIYYLSVPKKYFSDKHLIREHQSLFSLDLSTGKKREIHIPNNVSISRAYPSVVNNRIYFEGEKNIWSYNLKNKKWNNVYSEIPLQDIQFSQTTQLILATNSLENFGYTLLSIQEENEIKKPIGNYYQNFGFSPDGTKFLLKQKPNQDIFSDQSFLVVFSADGTSKDILTDEGDIIQAVWKDDQHIIAVIRDEEFEESILLVSVEKPDSKTEILNGGSVQWVNYKDNTLWIVTEEEIGDLNYDKNGDIQGLLNAFAELEKKYTIWSYDFETDELLEWPIEGFFPRTF